MSSENSTPATDGQAATALCRAKVPLGNFEKYADASKRRMTGEDPMLTVLLPQHSCPTHTEGVCFISRGTPSEAMRAELCFPAACRVLPGRSVRVLRSERAAGTNLHCNTAAAQTSSPAVPRIGPGATPFTRTPYSPHSKAKLRVMLSTAALAAEACT
eukprot:GHUV01018126.1.p1 GENE.GHUV01018126.1~~GHUV01018126.1.p1  ORF type:complete len:158 (+),score=34.78 GHUV01018126.1:1164-1637(+)